MKVSSAIAACFLLAASTTCAVAVEQSAASAARVDTAPVDCTTQVWPHFSPSCLRNADQNNWCSRGNGQPSVNFVSTWDTVGAELQQPSLHGVPNRKAARLGGLFLSAAVCALIQSIALALEWARRVAKVGSIERAHRRFRRALPPVNLSSGMA